VSLALFALVAAIWGILLLPLARRGHAEPAAREPRRDTPARLSRGARPWTAGDPPAGDADLDPEAAASRRRRARRRAALRRTAARRRRALLLLAVATAAGLRAWAVLGGSWWAAPAATGGLLLAYLVILVAAARRRSRAAPGRRAVRRLRLAGWTARRRRLGPVAPTTE
jgi:hypothetical protein